MLEILYRGKRKDNGTWVEGFYFCMVHYDGSHIHHFIIPLGVDLSFGTTIENIQVEVDPKTVCQYIGMHDNTKWEQLSESEQNRFLQEWNILENRWNTKEDWKGRKIFEGDILSFSQKGQNTSGIVKMEDGCFFAIIEGQKCWLSEGIKRYKGKIIGNIFDNSELIGMEGETEC